MNKFISIIFLLTILFSEATAQFNHAGRGMYVDKFFRTAINTSGATVVNPVFSILSITAKEDSLLKYAKDNHFTYLILYDLYYVIGNATYENYLCSFIQKAKTQYCIEYIGVASSCSGLFDNIFIMGPTPSISFSDPKFAGKYTPEMQEQLSVVEHQYKPGDSLFYISEVTKLSMNTVAFNDNCAYKLDVLVSEYEFWNTTADDCVGDSPSRDVKYVRYQGLINNMDVIRDNYNSTHTTHQVYNETYLGYLNLNTLYTHQVIADWIDGSYSGLRRNDRINLHYYGSDPSRLYSRTPAGQNYTGYYLTRFLDFSQATTNNQTNFHPIFSSEYIPWGADATYLGSWFSLSANNNIFTAEKFFYNDWYDDAHNYNPATIGSPTLGTVVQPGGVVWFTSRQLVGHLNNPVMFTSNSPVCVPAGQNGSFQFQYQGPIEQGSSFKFYITNAGTTTLRCGTTNPITWPAYNAVTQTSIDLNAVLSGCSLPAGDYDAHLECTYASGCAAYIAPVVRISVVNSGKIVALTSTTVCQGNPVYLQANSTGGGTTTYAWYDSTTPISGAVSSIFAPSASSTGTHNYSCLITSSNGSCSANRSNIIPVTINTFPAALITTQSSSSCSVTLQANPAGGSYLWHDGSSGPTYTTTLSGTYSVAVTVNGCTSLSPKFPVTSLSGSGTVVPSVVISASTGNTICVGTNVVFTANPVNGGTAPVYQWKKNGNNVGTNSTTYSNSTLANNEVISCVMTSNLPCASPLTATSNSITMTVNPVVAPYVSITSSTGNVICVGTNVTFTATPTNGGATPSYQWQKNGISVGANSNTYSDNALINSDVINCVMTSSAACPTTPTVTSSNIIMTVYSFLTPSIVISANPGNTICSGSNVTFTAVSTNGGSSPAFQWKKNGINVGTNSSTYSNTALLNGDIITCVLTSNAPCVTSPTATSNAITMTVNAIVTPALSISANPGNIICAGINVTFTALPVNGGAAPSYQWKKNGTIVGTNSITYSNSSLLNSDVISCVMTSNAVCLSITTATSNSITMTVNANVTPSISISFNPGITICAGVNVTFTAVPVNGGTTPSYQWKKNGTNVGTSSITYSNSALVNNDVINCVMTSNASCASPVIVTSNSITMTVNAILTPSVSISANPGNSICSGTNVTFSAAPVNGGLTPVYQWKINGTNTGASISTYSNNALNNSDVISCVMTSNAACVSTTTATSNSITMTVNQNIVPSVSISASPGTTICSGSNITFTAVPVNGGTTPSYQWKKNGTNVGTNSSTYSNSSLINNDVVSCVLTSNATCASPSTATSNSITVTVNSIVTPSVSISANPGNTICSGTNVTFTAVPVNGGVTPSYQWKKNGANTGTNNNTYSNNSLLNSDIITCVLTSNANCASPVNATSNSITMTVNANVTPSVSISANQGITICDGSNATFTAVPVNGGTTPSYQWKKNGTNVGTNSSTYSNSSLVNNDVISCVLTSNATCLTTATATSNNITMTVVAIPVPSVSITANTGATICSGTNVTFTAVPVNGGVSPFYQWKKNGSNVGINNNSYSDNTLVNNDIITCVMTSNANCASPATVSGNSITMIVTSNIIPSVSITANTGTTICSGDNVVFTAIPVNGGSTPVYQWKKNGNNVGSNNNSYSDNALLNNDVINCILSSNISCVTGNPASSNALTMTVNSCVLVTLNLKVFIQGYYMGNNKMIAVADPVNHPTLCDTIRLELHYATTPYNLASVSIDTIDINGNGHFVFNSIFLNQSYYIVVRHRNSLETWNKYPLLINSVTMSYDFTTSAGNAYGNNMADLGDGNFAIWSGDVSDGITSGNQDGIIDINDHAEIESAVQLFITGYSINDLTGDRIIESADFSLVEHNDVNTITTARP